MGTTRLSGEIRPSPYEVNPTLRGVGKELTESHVLQGDPLDSAEGIQESGIREHGPVGGGVMVTTSGRKTVHTYVEFAVGIGDTEFTSHIKYVVVADTLVFQVLRYIAHVR